MQATVYRPCVRYLGGKAKLAKHIAAAIYNEVGDAPIWEPFCGGLSVTVELAKSQRCVLAGDVHPALISLYKALWNGWKPPTSVSTVEYETAKSLPDSDPSKGFIGFGVSFGGKYFAGLARGGNRNHAAESARCLNGQFEVLRNSSVSFERRDFFDVQPHAGFGYHIYADPPYGAVLRNTSRGYRTDPTLSGILAGALKFDVERFWATCLEWVRCGIRVFVSEFECPLPHNVLWSVHRALSVDKDSSTIRRADSLYEVVLHPTEQREQDVFSLLEALDAPT